MNFKNNKAQSLIELTIGLGVSVLMIGAATGALLSANKAGKVTDQSQTAASLSSSLYDSLVTSAEANWGTIYYTSKNSTNKYHLINTPTTSVSVLGIESILGTDVVKGLMAQWQFDESGGVIMHDNGRFDHRGKSFGDLTRLTGVNCKIGGCLSFSGNGDHVFIGDKFDTPYTAPLTISLWISTAQSGGAFISKQGYDSPWTGWIFESYAPNQIRYQVYGSGGSNRLGKIWNVFYQDGNWHHLVLVKGNNAAANLKLYIDGVEQTSVAATYDTLTQTVSTNFNCEIGARDGTNQAFNGKMDDVRLYSRVLTADEISKLYSSSIFTRYFYVQNVSRDPNTQNVEATYDADHDDPSTQKITVRTNYTADGSSGYVELIGYLVRWVNATPIGTPSGDGWSGGSGVAGPTNTCSGDFANTFFDYSNLDYSSGLKVLGY
ncbi:MAG: LamG domain-containing protein [Candidatus Pacebacteria bacterium]|nr:LamG domain-containing protein [Candidatus Paceibacterota bacterium]